MLAAQRSEKSASEVSALLAKRDAKVKSLENKLAHISQTNLAELKAELSKMQVRGGVDGCTGAAFGLTFHAAYYRRLAA